MSVSRKKRSHSLAFKLEVVRRVNAGESASVVARSFEVSRGQVYLWLKQVRDHGGVGRPRGRPRHGPALPPPGSAGREVELERVIGQQQVELDFFRQALRRVREARRPIVGPGVAPSGGRLQPRRPGRKAEE